MASSGRTTELAREMVGPQRVGPTSNPKNAATVEPRSDVAVIDSATLLGGGREVHIRHGESVYRLILTRHDRLILNK